MDTFNKYRLRTMKLIKILLILSLFLFTSGAYAQSKFSDTSPSDITNTASTQVKAGVAGLKYVITLIVISNLHASVDTRVDVLSGSTVIMHCPAAHGGGGCVVPFSVEDPLPTVAGDGIFCRSSASATVRCTVKGQIKRP